MTAPVIVTDTETLRQIIREELAQVQAQAAAPAPIKLAYTIKEAAAEASMTEWHIRTAVKQGELHAKQAGKNGAYSIPRESLVSWLRSVPAPKKAVR